MLIVWLGVAAATVVVLWATSDRFAWGSVRLFARLWHGCRREGPDPLPATGPAIIIANHCNHADPAFLIACCRRPLCFLQAREQFNVVLLRRLFQRAGCIPVARTGHDVTAVRLALRRLRQGAMLAIFPAGDVGPENCQSPEQAKAGVTLLALRSQAPVFPVRITGARPAGTILGDWFRPSRQVRVAFGPAIDLAEFYDQPITRLLLKKVTAFLMKHLAELPPARHEAA